MVEKNDKDESMPDSEDDRPQHQPDMMETNVFRNEWDVDGRLGSLDLTRDGLLAVRDRACVEEANATPFHPANAPGTFRYHHSVAEIRRRFVGDNWVIDREDGIETIKHIQLGLRIGFSNVDIACNDHRQPQARSEKGAGAQRASSGGLFDNLPHFAPRPKDNGALFYLMVDGKGACELSRPIVRDKVFYAYVERLYLSEGLDDDVALLLDPDDGPTEAFDPQIARK